MDTDGRRLNRFNVKRLADRILAESELGLHRFETMHTRFFVDWWRVRTGRVTAVELGFSFKAAT